MLLLDECPLFHYNKKDFLRCTTMEAYVNEPWSGLDEVARVPCENGRFLIYE